MKYILVFFLMVSGAWAESFVAGMGDLPLAPGLETSENDVTFIEDAEQRIVETEAHGAKNPHDIHVFYDSALPNLGWSKQGNGYVREGELLTIKVDKEKVTFRIAPQK